MRIVNIHQAKVNSVFLGEEIIIAIKPKRHFGVLKGKIKIFKDFDAPLPQGLLQGFEN